MVESLVYDQRHGGNEHAASEILNPCFDITPQLSTPKGRFEGKIAIGGQGRPKSVPGV